MADHYANIRDIDQLGALVGQRVIEITQQDEEEFKTDGACYVALHFENGTTVTFHIGAAGFDIQDPD